MRYTLKTIAATAVCSLVMANSAMAELLIDPTAKSKMGEKQVSGFYATSTVTYDDDGTLDVDRTMLGASVAFGMSDTLDVYGTFAMITKAELEDFPADDSGTLIAIGVRGALPIQADIKLSGYAQYLMIDEDYGSVGNAKVSGKDTTISAGVMATTMMDSIKVYGGLELILQSDADLDYSNIPGLGSGTSSAERDDTFALRAGAVMGSGDIDINLALALQGEKGFMLGASKSF